MYINIETIINIINNSLSTVVTCILYLNVSKLSLMSSRTNFNLDKYQIILDLLLIHQFHPRRSEYHFYNIP